MKHYGSQLILNRASVTVGAGARIGLVGPNGIGKSTLLRILAGGERPDDGVLIRSPQSLTVGYLPQEVDADPGETLRDYLARRTGIAEAEAKLQDSEAQLIDDPLAADAHATALDKWMSLGGHDFDARASRVCAEVALSADRLGVPLGSLSGGQASRAALAGILLSRFDILLLDEPTNDLDFDGLATLEKFVRDSHFGLVVVSHDRAFLETCIDHVVEIEEGTHRTLHYSGGWAHFVKERDRARSAQYEGYAQYVADRKRLADAARRKREWARKGAARARRSEEPDKNIRFGRKEGAETLASDAKALEKRLEALEVVEKPWEGWQLRMKFAFAPRSGDVVFRLESASVRRRTFVLGPLDLNVHFGDRIAIVGPNGGGKTTLLDVLAGRVGLDAGNSQRGSGVVIGEMDQDRRAYRTGDDTLQVFRASVGTTEEEARSSLSKFALGATQLQQPSYLLSPGQRTRCLLAAYMARGVNCLVLDEPTNHLDIAALEELEAALLEFEGTVVAVSHDRRLLRAFRPTRVLEIVEGRISEFRDIERVLSERVR
jgi:ATPase subunit of ABC transporter with duplicated ATPase domains